MSIFLWFWRVDGYRGDLDVPEDHLDDAVHVGVQVLAVVVLEVQVQLKLHLCKKKEGF